MITRTLAVGAAFIALSAAAAFAQSEPGAGAPSNANGAPTTPNASVAPSMVPNGANMGTPASAITNSGTTSADQGPGAQTPQPGMRHGHRSSRPDSVNGSGMTPAPSSGPAPTEHP